MKHILYIVQPIGYEIQAEAFLASVLEEFKLLHDVEFRYSPTSQYLNYREDLDRLNSSTSAKAEIIDTRELMGVPIFENQESRLLFSKDFFSSSEVEKKEIFLHEVGHYITNQSLKEIRRFIALNSPNYLSISDKNYGKLCSDFNNGIYYIVQLIKLSQELNAELWVYENHCEYSYSRLQNFCDTLDSFILTEINEIEDKTIFFQLPQFYFLIMFRQIVISKTAHDYSEECTKKVKIATNKLLQIASKLGFRQMKMFKLKYSMIESLEYGNENHTLQISNYVLIFQDFIIKSLNFFPVYLHNDIKKFYKIE
jgi:hypothetical protein